MDVGPRQTKATFQVLSMDVGPRQPKATLQVLEVLLLVAKAPHRRQYLSVAFGCLGLTSVDST